VRPLHPAQHAPALLATGLGWPTEGQRAEVSLRPSAVSAGAENLGDSNDGHLNMGNNNAGRQLFGDFGRRWRLENEW
jgi:hypothetical protein